jgi:hypothetical protein
MTEVAPLRLVENDDGPPEPPGPTIFARSIAVPAGAPWDQRRAATLDAKLGAPLPLSDVVYKLWRLDAWAFRRPSRFAVAYVRAREIGERFDATAIVDGRAIRVRLYSMREQARRARVVGISIGAAIAGVLLVGGALAQALATHAEVNAKLAAVEATLAIRERQADTLERLKDQTRWLNASHVQGQSLDDALSDIAWASAAKNPAAHIDAFHWERGLFGITVRGDAAPLAETERTQMKVATPLKPGVWLWGVGPAGGAARAPSAGAGG